MMDNKKPEVCTVCLDNYDEVVLRPRVLWCGHTFCYRCIDTAIKNGQLTCPSCSAQHSATAATQFPINYGMEAMVKQIKGTHLTSKEAVLTKLSHSVISKKLRSLVEEQKSNISSLITHCEEALSQLGEYRGQLGDWKTHHLQLQDRLYGLVEHNKAAIKLLEQEDISVVDMTTQGEEGKTELQAMLGSLDTVNTALVAIRTIDTAYRCNVDAQDWLHKCQEIFPDVNTLHTSLKVKETIREVLKMMTTETGATVHLETIREASEMMTTDTGATGATVHLETIREASEIMTTDTGATGATVHLETIIEASEMTTDTGATGASVHLETIIEASEMMTTDTGATGATVHLGDSTSSIMNKVREITEGFTKEQITVDDLCRMSEPVKRLVEAGQVFAVQQDQDGRRSARITLQDEQLYLHPLLRQPTPAHAHTIQESAVVGVLDPSSTLAFLDLGWAGSRRGRVIIQLTPDTPLARQFVLLCTGQRGHTYRNTKLLWVAAKGQPGECVVGGDYESNDGEGGAPLLPDMRGQYRRSGRAGAVWSWWLAGVWDAQFTITTRDHQAGDQYPRVFGEVVSGLDVVRAAVNHSDITEVTVVDCGVVLPL